MYRPYWRHRSTTEKVIFSFEDFDITLRELIFSIIILFAMLGIGFYISGQISNSVEDRNMMYHTAAKITTDQMFDYAVRTDAGNAFVAGVFSTPEPLVSPVISGEYLVIRQVHERYTMHTYTTSDRKGRVTTHIYWSWDYAGEESYTAKEILFRGLTFSNGKFNFGNCFHSMGTVGTGCNTRDVYSGVDNNYSGTIFTKIKNHTITDNSVVYDGQDIASIEKNLTSGFEVVIFWIIWIPLTGAALVGFYYIPNDWLETEKN